jgi:acyl-CoA reductase-like NAD-dependent aldehyde dehydrogenase
VKIRHNINPTWVRPSSPIYSEATDERYEAEVSASVRRAEKAWRKAQKALERAERKALRKSTPSQRQQIEELRRLVAARWQELHELEVQMQQGPSTGFNRSGKGSVRNPLPKGSKL